MARRLAEDVDELFAEAGAQRLAQAGICTVVQFVEADLRRLGRALGPGCSQREILAAKERLVRRFGAAPQDGLRYLEALVLNRAILPTGVANLDTLLGGGLQTSSIYEICGQVAVGKTQLCLTIANNAAYNLSQSVYFLDTKNEFSGKKVQHMLESKHLTEKDITETMERIKVKFVNSMSELINSMYSIREELKNGLKLRIIIIDSLLAVMNQCETKTANLTLCNNLVNIVRNVCVQYHVVVIVVNLSSKCYGTFENPKEAPKEEKIFMGKYWRHIPNVRLLMGLDQEAGERKITVLKSLSIERNQACTVKLGNEGIS